MADSVKLANMVRVLAIVHIIVGILLIFFGIADRLFQYSKSWTGSVYFGVWIGVWVSINICKYVISDCVKYTLFFYKNV